MIEAAAEPASGVGSERAVGEKDVYLFREGTHAHLQSILGCSLHGGSARFRVWAPNATRVSVIGDWNGWDERADPLVARRDETGLWEGWVRGVARGQAYKYRIVTRDGAALDKADPFGIYAEVPPATASRAWTLDYDWGDDAWMGSRGSRNALAAPMSIYEMHLGSWRRPEAPRLPTYRGIAEPLADYVSAHSFTHVEFLPLMEHPFYGS